MKKEERCPETTSIGTNAIHCEREIGHDGHHQNQTTYGHEENVVSITWLTPQQQAAVERETTGDFSQ